MAETGSVGLAVIKSYVQACTWIMSVLVLFFYAVSSSMSISSNFWLAEWSNANGRFNSSNFSAITFCDHPDYLDL